MVVNVARMLGLHRIPGVQRWAQQIQLMPVSTPENSIELRALAQALVIVGIVATDIAAETSMSLWAVPFSLIGAVWSWHRRGDRNIPTKFALAFGMLLAMAAFLGQMLGQREVSDTRMILVELLIQLQVLHSFDLPRRKDLGYSMVIGLILIGVASTLSQTMTFGLLLLLFLVIALPTLALDYRSRLGIVGINTSKTPVKWRFKTLYPLLMPLCLTIVLGLGLFVLIPRFPGYRWRTFPMSAPINVQQEFNNQTILNPGYVRPSQGGRGPGGGASGMREQGPGEFDETSYYGFGSRINQNLRGMLKPRVMLRVRSQAAGFWRVQAFDRYTGQGWEVSRNEQTTTIDRVSWAYHFFLPRRVTLNRSREVVQTYTVISDLPNLIPALVQPKELYFPTQQVAVDLEDALRSPIGLMEGLTYTVISEVPYRDRTRLQAVQQRLPNVSGNPYLQIPPAIAPKVRQRTEAILATSPKPLTVMYEKALYLAQYLKQNYQEQTELPFLNPQEDLVEAFLFRYKGGYGDHFSTTLTMMLRSIGIASRLVVGFAPGEFNPFTGLYVVKNTDAYAMTEVYFPKFGWFAFDPIPGHELLPPGIEEDQTFTVLQTFWKWVAGWLPSPVSSWLNRVFGAIADWLGKLLSHLMGFLSKGWLNLFAGLIVTVLLSFLGWLSWQGWQRWRYQRWLNRLPAMASLYCQMLDWLARQGFPKHPAQTPLEYAQQAQAYHPPQLSRVIQDISCAYVSWRYGDSSPDLPDLKQRFKIIQKTRLKARKNYHKPVSSL